MGDIADLYSHLRLGFQTKNANDCPNNGTASGTHQYQHNPPNPQYEQSPEYDPISIIYNYIKDLTVPSSQSNWKEENTQQDTTPEMHCHPNNTGMEPLSIHDRRFMFTSGAAMVIIPAVVFTSVISPSLYGHGDNTCKKPRRLLICMQIWSVVFLVIVRLIESVGNLSEMSLCVAMHSSFLCSHTVIQAMASSNFQNRQTQVFMHDGCVLAMGLTIGCQCFWLTVSSDTPISKFSPTTFFSNHLAATLIVDILRPIVWYIGEYIQSA